MNRKTKRVWVAVAVAFGLPALILGGTWALGLTDLTGWALRVTGITIGGTVLVGVACLLLMSPEPSARARARTRDAREDQSRNRLAEGIERHNAREARRTGMIEQVLDYERQPMATPAGAARALQLDAMDDHELAEAFANAQRRAYVDALPTNPGLQWVISPKPTSPAFNTSYRGDGDELLQPVAERWMTPGAAESHFGAGEEVMDVPEFVERPRDAEGDTPARTTGAVLGGPLRGASNLRADTAATAPDFNVVLNSGGQPVVVGVDMGAPEGDWTNGPDPRDAADAFAYAMTVAVGAPRRAPTIDELMELAASPELGNMADHAARRRQAMAVSAVRTQARDEHWAERLNTAEDLGSPGAGELRRFLTDIDSAGVLQPEQAARVVEAIRALPTMLTVDGGSPADQCNAIAVQAAARADVLASALVQQAGVISTLRGRLVASEVNDAAHRAHSLAPGIGDDDEAYPGDGVTLSPSLLASMRAAGREVTRTTLQQLGWVYTANGWTLWDERDGIEPDANPSETPQ